LNKSGKNIVFLWN